MSTSIGFRMNVSRGDWVLVPGCEPTSTLTSTRMTSEMQRLGLCSCAIVDLQDILDAIPGAYVEYIPNSGYMGSTKILVLPAYDQSCPCAERPDYYATLRSLCREATEEELQELSGCDSFSIDQCESRPEWRGQE
jgi:hypothetical protein